jgi:hypothetical protein
VWTCSSRWELMVAVEHHPFWVKWEIANHVYLRCAAMGIVPRRSLAHRHNY